MGQFKGEPRLYARDGGAARVLEALVDTGAGDSAGAGRSGGHRDAASVRTQRVLLADGRSGSGRSARSAGSLVDVAPQRRC